MLAVSPLSENFHAMAAAVLATGARVVPVDCRADSLCLDPEDLKRARTSASKAVLIHNPWGMPADFQAIREVSEGLKLISDASHAHGATYRGEPLGKWADITCYSLGVQKLISGGELGCAVTDDEELRDRMLVRGHVNRVPSDLKTDFWQGNAVDLKMRPHALALILAAGQLKRFPEKVATLRDTCATIESRLVEHGFCPQSADYEYDRVWWRIVLRAPRRLSREEVERGLRAAAVPVEPNHYEPELQSQSIFQWPEYSGRLLSRNCPTVLEVQETLVTLPGPVKLEGLETKEDFFLPGASD